MNEFYIRNVIEAALLAAGKPLQLADIGQLFDESTRPSTDDLRAAIDTLAADYSNRGIEVKETAAGFRIQVRREFSAEISRLWPERPARYSRALLETLALIAYRQPITRAEIESVRGVAVNPNIVKTVIERNWVRVVGHRDVPGRPELLGTTREFLDYFGLRSLDELPPLAELKAMGDYNLQLELPNGVAADGEAKPQAAAASEGTPETAEGGAAAAVALLTLDASAAEAAHATADPHDGPHSGAIGDESVLAASDFAPDSPEVAHVASADADAASVEHGAVVDTHAGSVEQDATSDSHVASATHAAESDPSDATHAVARSNTGEGAGHPDADSDAEADLTLSSGEAEHHASAESDDSETSPSATSNDSLDALDDSGDDDADEDELSADGHGSRELVAAPPDIDD
jgi:segregation and condensation protein B